MQWDAAANLMRLLLKKTLLGHDAHVCIRDIACHTSPSDVSIELNNLVCIAFSLSYIIRPRELTLLVLCYKTRKIGKMELVSGIRAAAGWLPWRSAAAPAEHHQVFFPLGQRGGQERTCLGFSPSVWLIPPFLPLSCGLCKAALHWMGLLRGPGLKGSCTANNRSTSISLE